MKGTVPVGGPFGRPAPRAARVHRAPDCPRWAHEDRPAPERRQDVPTENAVEDKPAEEPSEAKPEIQPEKSDKTAKVVFTDGRKIVRKNNGRLIEVPRTFSYTGAGLKKPFWIYDRKLGEAKMEAEAKLEKQARETWRALYEEALRQEEK